MYNIIEILKLVQDDNRRNKVDSKLLTTLGLGIDEAKIYTLLVEEGKLTAKEITLRINLKKGDCYNKLYRLIDRGLIEEIYNKKKYFRIEHPEKLQKLLEQKNQDFEDSKKRLIQELPQIISNYNLLRQKPGVYFFEGIDGIKQVYQDTLKYPNKDIYALASIETIPSELVCWLESYYVKARRQKNIKAYVIANKSKKALEYKAGDKNYLRETKLVEPGKFAFRMEINLYGDSKVVFISYSSQELIGVIMESKAVYETMRAFFNLVW